MWMGQRVSLFVLGAGCLAAFGFAQVKAVPIGSATGQAGPKVSPITIDLELAPRALDMDALAKSNMGYMPSGQQLVDEKPAGILKEPAYKGKPIYGAFRVGNGPRSITYFAIDEVKGQEGRVFFDLNQNGDLTDDGPGKWDTAKEYEGVLNYMSFIAVHASWGSPVHEDEGGNYTLMVYKRQGDARVGWTKVTARSGKLKIGEKTYNILLAENSSDAIFTVPRRLDRTRRPVTLLIDLDGDGTFKGSAKTVDGKKMVSREQFSLDQPFQIDGAWWEGLPSISGAELTLIPSVAPGETAVAAQAPVEQKQLLAAGTPAPDFTAATPTGQPIKLSDFKGKIVILDFWATWCGPCQASMPGLQKIYNQIKSQNVVVLSLNVWDAKDPFDTWIEKNSGSKYNFTFAYDAAGRGKTSIASEKFNVSGIPTMYIIGTDGKVKASIVGSENEKTIVAELAKLGVKAKAD